MRYIANVSVLGFQTTFYITLVIIVILNSFLVLGFFFRSIYWIENINSRYIG